MVALTYGTSERLAQTDPHRSTSTTMSLDSYKFGVQTFATFALLGPLGGPYNTADWASYLRSKNIRTMAIYAIQALWFLERLAAGLGMWFFLLVDWNHTNSFVAIEILWMIYAVLDWFGWPAFYFYPDSQRNYWFVAGIYLAGWGCLVAAWIVMVIQQAFTTATAFFWTSFALSVFSSLLALVLGGFLIYVYRQQMKSVSALGRTPTINGH
jgi:hypothetical protein